MGCNTVETYVPWNLHEPKQGEYDFDGIKDIEKDFKFSSSIRIVCDIASIAIFVQSGNGWLTSLVIKIP